VPAVASEGDGDCIERSFDKRGDGPSSEQVARFVQPE
jgi:hypothetical protein